jgi:tripartite ATP-independent transporter DctP family solute receptor
VRTGSLDMVITSTAPLVGILPSIGVFDLPFLFATSARPTRCSTARPATTSPAKLTGVGLVNLAWWENGFRNTTNSKRAIVRLEDFDGVKMRVMQNPIYIDTFKALGSNAVPMAFSEVYSALETKTVDGQENPFANIENQKFYEVQKYLTLTRHAYSPLVVLLSKKTWDTMSAQEQAAMKECAASAATRSAASTANRPSSSVANLKSKGMIVNDISPPRCSASATAPGRSTSSTARRSATRRSTWCSAS